MLFVYVDVWVFIYLWFIIFFVVNAKKRPDENMMEKVFKCFSQIDSKLCLHVFIPIVFFCFGI